MDLTEKYLSIARRLNQEETSTNIQAELVDPVIVQTDSELVCRRCPASAMWESKSGKGLHCFSYALFYPVKGGMPEACEVAVKTCEHRDNIDELVKKYST